MFYRIPTNLPAELAELDTYIGQFAKGSLDAAALKARRVPFGCYEQRKDGTYMVRIRTTGGALTPAQLKSIADISTRFGSDFIHVTSRQEFQIHDLALGDVTAVMRALLDCGLSTRGGGGNTVRNILVSPDAGIGSDEVFDPSPYAFALTGRLIAETDSWLLPRKLKIAFSNSPADTAYAQFNDVGFIARIENGIKGFRVFVAGGMGVKPEVGHLLHDFIPSTDVYRVAEAVKRLFDKHGNRKNRYAARLRFLWRTLGETQFRHLYDEELRRLQDDDGASLAIEDLPVPPAAPPIAALAASGRQFEDWKDRFVSPQRQAGLVTVLLPIFLGNLQNSDAVALAVLLGSFGPQTIRAVFGQNLRLRNIPESHLGNVWSVVGHLAGTAGPRVVADAVACTGASTCKLGICLPRGALGAIAQRLATTATDLDGLGPLQLSLSGCPNSCGQHMLADLGFYGNAARHGQRMYPAYAVVAGARHAEGAARLARPVGRVSARDLPDFVDSALATWLARRPAFASFADYVDGPGEAELRALADRFAEIPDAAADQAYYRDWGASEPFSLVGHGSGECSAGLFDLIEIDLKNARRILSESAAPDGAPANGLSRAVLRAARALLITRAVEADSDDAILSAFHKHFIDAGLIDGRFTALIEAARTGDAQDGEGVAALIEAVDALYRSMDDSLRVIDEKALATPPATTDAVARDYRSVVCPMNFVKVKLDLEKMAPGQRLRVLLDDGEPIRNVPRSVAAEGHKILEQTAEGGAWAVLIEKV